MEIKKRSEMHQKVTLHYNQVLKLCERANYN